MTIQAEISFYPLGQRDLLPAIDAFVKKLRARGLQVEMGEMSSIVRGTSIEVFDGLREAFETVGDDVARVLVVKFLALPGDRSVKS